MIKSTTTARDWVVFDTSRDPINLSDHRLDPSNTGAEFNAALDLDILSDGFKFRSDDIDGNADWSKIHIHSNGRHRRKRYTTSCVWQII